MDATALLARRGLAVTRRADGLYDAYPYGRGVTLAQLADLLLALATWPNCLPRVAPPIPVEPWPEGE